MNPKLTPYLSVQTLGVSTVSTPQTTQVINSEQQKLIFSQVVSHVICNSPDNLQGEKRQNGSATRRNCLRSLPRLTVSQLLLQNVNRELISHRSA